MQDVGGLEFKIKPALARGVLAPASRPLDNQFEIIICQPAASSRPASQLDALRIIERT